MSRLRVGLMYLLTVAAVGVSALFLSSISPFIDSGQASLLFLLVVLGVGVGLGLGPACLAALLCFGSWDALFAHHDLHASFPTSIRKPDLLTFIVYVVTGVVAARLSSLAKEQTSQALSRESEISLLFEASETIGKEIDATGAVSALSDLLRSLCRAPKCIVWKVISESDLTLSVVGDAAQNPENDDSPVYRLAKAAAEHRTVIGFDRSSAALWRKGAVGSKVDAAKVDGAYVPLITDKRLIGVLYVKARQDGEPFSEVDERLIMTLANDVAFVLQRDSLYEDAAMAAALRESDILKDSLLSLVSHELRSPLAAIKATVSAAELEEDPRESLNAITSQADRLTEIVSNILDLSRLEAGAWQPERDWCDVGEIISTALDSLPDTDSTRVDLRTEGMIPLVQADYIQGALAIKNVIQNAAKYSPADARIDMTVATEYNGSDERPSGVSIRVRDFGRGIPSNEHDKVFERFFRSREQKRSGVPGTGLGLALVKAIISAHGGRVWVSNPPSGEPSGAIFTIVLPVE
jgi:two-component system sensor histidine kinase KdpD